MLATGLSALCYFALQGELPYHDAKRFVNQVSDGIPVWDIAHVLLQPVALILQRLSGAAPVVVLKALSTLSTAVAVGLFHLLLIRLEVPRWKAMLGTLLLAGSCSVLTLAPSAHPKLVAFPFINGALLCLCLVERRNGKSIGLLLLGGGLLAVAGAFLASVLTTAPFAALALMVAGRRNGAGWLRPLGQAAVMTGACGLTFLAIACTGYVVLTGGPLSVAGLTGSITGKSELRPAPVPLAIHLARIVFGTVNNLVALPNLGATAQAWMRGQIPSLRPYSALLPLLALWIVTALLIVAIYARTAVVLALGRPRLMPIAFLCGAQTWTMWYGLNDPEHWFQLTAPTIVLFLTLMPSASVRLLLPTWAVVATAVNLMLLALPVAVYPLARNSAELARILGPEDLLVLFGSYPGRPYAEFYSLPGVPKLYIDLLMREPGATEKSVMYKVNTEINRTLRDGGRAVVADILDSLDWEAPWMALLGQKVSKGQVQQALTASRTIIRLRDIGGIKLWELQDSTSMAPPLSD